MKKIFLYGFFNEFDNIPSFIKPLFKSDRQFFMQSFNENFNETTFCPVQLSPDSPNIIKLDHKLNMEGHKLPIYGFIFEDKSIIFDVRENFCVLLKSREAEIADAVFIYIDVLKFLGEQYKIKDQILRAKDILSIHSKEIAENWANQELKDLENRP